MKKRFKILVLSSSFVWLSGFVLLSGPDEAHFDASESSPVIDLHWDGSNPPLEDVQEYKGGVLVGLSDEVAMQRLIEDALAQWNQVPGSFIQLNLVRDETTEIDPEDGLHSIRVLSLANAAAAAFAVPIIRDGVITDCDISLGSQSVSAKSLAYTILHEVGHCLGLGHAHTNYGAVMGYARSSRMLTLGLDDMAGLIYLYPMTTQDSGAELYESYDQRSCGGAGFGLWFLLWPVLQVVWIGLKKLVHL